MVLLPFLIGMNFIEYGSSKYLPVFIVGKHTDFGAKFYTDIGYQLVLTMLIFTF